MLMRRCSSSDRSESPSVAWCARVVVFSAHSVMKRGSSSDASVGVVRLCLLVRWGCFMVTAEFFERLVDGVVAFVGGVDDERRTKKVKLTD